MGRFAGLAGIKTNNGGIYFEQGNYLVRLLQIQFKDTRKGDTFIIETEVLESDNPARGPGSKPSQVIVFKTEYLKTILGDVKQFVGAVLEIPDPDAYVAQPDPAVPGDTVETATDRFWDQAIESLVSEDQPAKGVLIRVCCFTKPKKLTAGMFTKHVWGPVVQEAA